MLQKFILNDMAKELTKHERDTLNNIINTMVSDAYKFLGPDEYKDYKLWFGCRTNGDLLSPLTVRDPSITSKEYKRQYEESWDVKFNKTAHQQFRVFKKGLRKISQVKFANPELIYLTVQARTKLNYPYNIYALCEDDTLGKYYLEKVMSIVSLHYENLEV